MNLQRDTVRAQIRQKIMTLAEQLGADATSLSDADSIPATGLLDSAALLELVAWYENQYEMSLKPEDINVDNLGSVNAMTDFLMRRKG